MKSFDLLTIRNKGKDDRIQIQYITSLCLQKLEQIFTIILTFLLNIKCKSSNFFTADFLENENQYEYLINIFLDVC